MGPSGAQPGIPFPHTSRDAIHVQDNSVPRSLASELKLTKQPDSRNDMDVDDSEPTPTKRINDQSNSATLPSIKNLFGIERADALSNVQRSRGPEDAFAIHNGPFIPGSPSTSQTALPSLVDINGYGAGGSTFPVLHSSASSSLGPIRTRRSSNSSSYSRSSIVVPSTPPRVSGLGHSIISDDPSRRRMRQAQTLKGLILSPPMRRMQLETDGSSEHPATPHRHTPGSSTGSMSYHPLGPSQIMSRPSQGHISTISDPSPMLPPGYPSTQTLIDSSVTDPWTVASNHSSSTSPRTSWHSRSSTLESGESAYKTMHGGDVARDFPPPLLPSFREAIYPSADIHLRSPQQSYSSLTRHGSLRTPASPSDLSATRRPRSRTLTFSNRPTLPIPTSDDSARRQTLEAASELLLIGQQRAGPDPVPPAAPSRLYGHKHSLSMQERSTLPIEIHSSETPRPVRTHKPKSQSLSDRAALELPSIPYSNSVSDFDSYHPRRGRGAADDPSRPGAGFVFPHRPVPDPAEVQRTAFQAQMMRGQGLASVPDGMVSDRPIHPNGPRSTTTGTIASGQAKYECAWCGKRFSRPSSLKIHHHSHTGEKPFVCNEPGCGRSFSVQSNLRRHQKCHVPSADQGQHSRSSSMGSVQVRSDDASGMWARNHPQPSRITSSLATLNSNWHPTYATMHIKDHPPLSRSAFEPGSRTMSSWNEMRQETPLHPHPAVGGHEPAPMESEHPSHFTQMRERRPSESSADDDNEERLQHMATLASLIKSPKHEVTSLLGGPPSILSSDDEDKKPTTRMRSGTSSSTSGLRLGFSSLLNPTQEATTVVKDEE